MAKRKKAKKAKAKKGKKKRKLSPSMKAYSSCVKELGINPRLLKKGTKTRKPTLKKLRSCAEKKLARKGIKIKPKK